MPNNNTNAERRVAGGQKKEFPKGEKGVIFCNECGAAYFMKSWRHALEEYKSTPLDTTVKFKLCPACEMIKNHQFEGRIIAKDVPEKEVGDLMGLLENQGVKAQEKDVLHRIIEVKKVKSEKGFEVTVTTTENQLANKLADKIKSAFKKTKVSRSFSSAPGAVEYVTIEFLG